MIVAITNNAKEHADRMMFTYKSGKDKTNPKTPVAKPKAPPKQQNISLQNSTVFLFMQSDKIANTNEVIMKIIAITGIPV